MKYCGGQVILSRVEGGREEVMVEEARGGKERRRIKYKKIKEWEEKKKKKKKRGEETMATGTRQEGDILNGGWWEWGRGKEERGKNGTRIRGGGLERIRTTERAPTSIHTLTIIQARKQLEYKNETASLANHLWFSSYISQYVKIYFPLFLFELKIYRNKNQDFTLIKKKRKLNWIYFEIESKNLWDFWWSLFGDDGKDSWWWNFEIEIERKFCKIF